MTRLTDKPSHPASRATFAAGCFWCTEAVYTRLRGVSSVIPGYANGSSEFATYADVQAGSGHAEAVQITYDPAVISYDQLLTVFFGTHDPTTPDRQGHDIGPQYRSAIFTHDEEQREVAERVKKQLTHDQIFSAPIITLIEPLRNFTPAERSHKNYYALNRQEPYCQMVIDPKIAKLRSTYAALLKPDM